MMITVDILYYNISSVDYSLDGEMNVKYSSCLQHIYNASLHHIEESSSIIKQVIELAMSEMNDPRVTTFLT